MFFPSEKDLFIWIYLLKETTRRTKILISPIGNKILEIWVTLFEFKQIEVQCSKDYFKIFLPEEGGAFGNKMQKKPQKPRPKLKKYMYYIFKENICSACNPTQVVAFCKGLLILKKRRLKFSHIKGSIIP